MNDEHHCGCRVKQSLTGPYVDDANCRLDVLESKLKEAENAAIDATANWTAKCNEIETRLDNKIKELQSHLHLKYSKIDYAECRADLATERAMMEQAVRLIEVLLSVLDLASFASEKAIALKRKLVADSQEFLVMLAATPRTARKDVDASKLMNGLSDP